MRIGGSTKLTDIVSGHYFGRNICPLVIIVLSAPLLPGTYNNVVGQSPPFVLLRLIIVAVCMTVQSAIIARMELNMQHSFLVLHELSII